MCRQVDTSTEGSLYNRQINLMGYFFEWYDNLFRKKMPFAAGMESCVTATISPGRVAHKRQIVQTPRSGVQR